MEGLGIIPGAVQRFDDSALTVPHIGWNGLQVGARPAPPCRLRPRPCQGCGRPVRRLVLELASHPVLTMHRFLHRALGAPSTRGCLRLSPGGSQRSTPSGVAHYSSSTPSLSRSLAFPPAAPLSPSLTIPPRPVAAGRCASRAPCWRAARAAASTSCTPIGRCPQPPTRSGWLPLRSTAAISVPPCSAAR